MSNQFRLSLALLLAASPVALNQAKAQTIQLDEITVQGKGEATDGKGQINGYVPKLSATGTKTATPLRETPQSVVVVGAKEIRDIGAQTVDQAVAYVSGVRADTFGSDTRNDWFLIRGFPAQTSGYFLDGLQLYSTAFATFRVEPFGLERLEILKGPASVLYGGSNVGGIINAASKRPPEVSQGTIETGINNYGNAYAAFDIGGPVSSKPNNEFYYRFEGLARGGGTQVSFTDDDRVFIAPSLTWAPDAGTKVTILGSYEKDHTNGQNFLPYVGTVTPAPFGKISTSLFTSEPGYDKFERSQALIGYEIEHKLNDTFTVRQNARYANLKIDYQTLFGVGYATDPAAADLSRLNFLSTPVVNEVALDNQLEARFHTGAVSHVALLGLDYKRYTLMDGQAFAFDSPISLVRPVYAGPTVSSLTQSSLNNETQDQLGIYAQEQAKLGRFTLVLSGRHDSLSTDLDNYLSATKTTSTDGAFTGRAGVIYDLGYNVSPYATVATSFDPQLGVNTSTMKALVPTTGVLKEVGVKYDPIPDRLSLTGALFDLTQNNVLTTDPNNITNTVQTGQENSRGFELQAQGNITDGLKVLASYTGYRLRDTSDLNTALIGKVPVNTPQAFGSMLLDYTIQSGPLQGFGFGAGPRYVGSSYASTDNTFVVPSYVLGDATVHFERGHWRASVNVTNLADKVYVASCQSTSACFYGLRRTSLFRLAYSW